MRTSSGPVPAFREDATALHEDRTNSRVRMRATGSLAGFKQCRPHELFLLAPHVTFIHDPIFHNEPRRATPLHR